MTKLVLQSHAANYTRAPSLYIELGLAIEHEQAPRDSMQPLPLRLVQSTRLAFRSSRPLFRQINPLKYSGRQQAFLQRQWLHRCHLAQTRPYSTDRDSKEGENLARKERQILQSSKNEAASKPSADLTRSHSP